MAERSAIEWTDASWNPVRAGDPVTLKIGWHCEHVSEGCRNCYAETFNARGLPNGGTGLGYKPGHRDDVEIFLDEKMLLQPLRWRKPRKIFVGSMFTCGRRRSSWKCSSRPIRRCGGTRRNSLRHIRKD